jgi:hypothetical protein
LLLLLLLLLLLGALTSKGGLQDWEGRAVVDVVC